MTQTGTRKDMANKTAARARLNDLDRMRIESLGLPERDVLRATERATEQRQNPNHLRAETICWEAGIPMLLTTLGWDRADVAEIDRGTLKKLVLAAYAAGRASKEG